MVTDSARPEDAVAADARHRQAHLVSGVAWATLAGVAVYSLGMVIRARAPYLRWAGAATVFTLTSLTTIALVQRGRVRLGGIVYLAVMWSSLVALMVTGGGLSGPAVIGFLVMILVAGLVFGWRAGLAVALASLAVEVAVALATHRQLLPLDASYRGPFDLLLTQTLIGIIVLAIVYLYARDMSTSLAKAQRELAERTRMERHLAAESHILEMMSTGFELEAILAEIARTLEGSAPEVLASVLLLDEDGIHVHLGAAPSLPAGFSRAIDGAPIGPKAGSCGTAAHRRELVVVTDIATDPLWEDYRGLALSHGLRACWSTPIQDAQQAVLGTFAMYYREPRTPSPMELKFVERSTHLAGVAIERKRAELRDVRSQHSIRERVKELTVLHRVAKILEADELATDEKLRDVVAHLPGGWQHVDVAVARITFDGAEYPSSRFVPTAWMQRAEFRTPDERAGLIEVGYLEERPAEAEGPFLAEERNLISTLAEMLGAHLGRVAAEVRVKRQLDHFTALHEIDMAILESMELSATLDVVLDQATGRLGADASRILVRTNGAATLRVVAERGITTANRNVADDSPDGILAHRVFGARKIVFLPGDSDSGKCAFEAAHGEGGYVGYCGMPITARGEIRGVLELLTRSRLVAGDDWLALVRALAGQTAIAISNRELIEGLRRSNVELAVAYNVTLEGWSRALDLRDKETEGHTARVVEMTLMLGRAMGMTDEQLAHMRRGALLHDVGKLGIPDTVLLKPGPLTEEEWDVMRRHPSYAYEWLSPIAYLRPALDIPYCHHEKWDGNGYPRGLRGEAIPLAARLFAVADVFDGLTSARPYHAGWTREAALEHIRAQSGKHFDPRVVEVFLRVMGEARGMGAALEEAASVAANDS